MISVIVPIYKVEAYLHQCVDSILGQKYRDIEILLIDDGSPDRCGEICEEYARIDTRIRVFHTENQGLSAARNLGLREARGEYVGFVDSDDWLDPDMYEFLLHRLEETETNICACGVWREYQNCRNVDIPDNGVFFGTEAMRELIHNPNCFAWNKLYKKAFWTGIGFPVNHTHEDIGTIYKVMLKANSLSYIPKPLYHYRMRSDNISHTVSMNNCIDFWDAHYGRYSFFSAHSEFKMDREIQECLEKQIAFAAVGIWRWAFLIPKEQRDYVFFHMISDFVRRNIPVFGKKNWSIVLRTGIFFCRYANVVSFFVLHIPNRIYVLVKNTIKKPFPPCSSEGMVQIRER